MNTVAVESPSPGSDELVDFVLAITLLPCICVIAVLAVTGTSLTGTLGYYGWLAGVTLYASTGFWLVNCLLRH